MAESLLPLRSIFKHVKIEGAAASNERAARTLKRTLEDPERAPERAPETPSIVFVGHADTSYASGFFTLCLLIKLRHGHHNGLSNHPSSVPFSPLLVVLSDSLPFDHREAEPRLHPRRFNATSKSLKYLSCLSVRSRLITPSVLCFQN